MTLVLVNVHKLAIPWFVLIILHQSSREVKIFTLQI
jgi:hypothetical protein